MNEQNESLKRLAQILDACGANHSGWPEDERAAMQSLIRKNAAARELVNEAMALEGVLNAAPPADDVLALKSRILSKAMALKDQTKTAQVIAFPKPAVSHENPAGRLGAAALLAASLILGVWVGASGYAEGIVTAPMEAAGLNTDNQFMSDYVSGLNAAEELL